MTWRLPAEWEPQCAVQLTWPHEETDWKDYLEAITQTYIEMALAITRFERLIIVAPDTAAVERLLRSRMSDAQWAMVTLHQCPTNDTWARDHGGITLVRSGKRETGSKQGETSLGQSKTKDDYLLLDFCFNGWGEKFEAAKDNDITRSLFEAGLLRGSYENHLDFVLEGGSIESDGQGTILTTTGCLMAPHRNQPLTREEIETELCRRLRANRVLWLNHGHLEGDDTDGHIDTLARLAPNDTILYIRCTDPTDTHYADLKAMEDDLKALRTRTGKPYRLLPLPMAAPITTHSLLTSHSDERLPATYANFLVINDAVIYPTYADPERDAEAARVLGEAFPNRELIGIDSRMVVLQHGSLHCCTMQFPA